MNITPFFMIATDLRNLQLTAGVDEANIQILVRDFDEKGLLEKEMMIGQAINRIKDKYPEADINMNVEESYRNMKQVLDNHPEVLEKAEQAIRAAGLKPNRTSIRGGTDGARLSFMGLPTPNLFTGGNNFHSRIEWVVLEDMEKAAEVIVHLMKVWTE